MLWLYYSIYIFPFFHYRSQGRIQEGCPSLLRLTPKIGSDCNGTFKHNFGTGGAGIGPWRNPACSHSKYMEEWHAELFSFCSIARPACKKQNAAMGPTPSHSCMLHCLAKPALSEHAEGSTQQQRCLAQLQVLVVEQWAIGVSSVAASCSPSHNRLQWSKMPLLLRLTPPHTHTQWRKHRVPSQGLAIEQSTSTTTTKSLPEASSASLYSWASLKRGRQLQWSSKRQASFSVIEALHAQSSISMVAWRDCSSNGVLCYRKPLFFPEKKMLAIEQNATANPCMAEWACRRAELGSCGTTEWGWGWARRPCPDPWAFWIRYGVNLNQLKHP